MATKQPVKASKTAAKPSLPVKKAVPAKKSAAAKPVAPAKKVVPAKAPVASQVSKPAAKTADKISKPASKSIKAAPAPVKKTAPAKQAAAKTVAAVKKVDAKKTGEQVKKTPNTEKVKQAAKPEVKEQAAPEKKVTAKKQVIVPSKPAVEPKAAKAEKKAETSKPAKPVAIPKTSTDKKVTYEPEFVKSVLDAPEQTVSQGPIMRYSDTDLAEFRELINKKLDAAKKELGYLQGLITRKDEMGGDESDNRYMTMEDGSMSMEREQLSQMASRQITFIDHLEKAIMRIENKTYGICRVTGKLIDKARLRAVPHATLSMEAKLGIAK